MRMFVQSKIIKKYQFALTFGIDVVDLLCEMQQMVKAVAIQNREIQTKQRRAVNNGSGYNEKQLNVD